MKQLNWATLGCGVIANQHAGKRQNALFRCKPHSPKGS